MPFFSIIIPTFNRARIIRRPIDSIIAQTFTDWELIIVDDGSTDDTKSVVDSYLDKRIRYVWQENQERNAARNTGLRLSSAEWICFLDSDDEYYPNHLSTLYEAINCYPEYKIYYTEMEFVSNDGSVKVRPFYSKNLSKFDPPDSLCLVAINKIVFSKIRLPEHLVSSEDFYFMALAGSIFDIKKLGIITYRYHNEIAKTSLIGPTYYIHLSNKLTTLHELLMHKPKSLIPFIKKKICVYSILLLYGHIRYNSKLIFAGMLINLKTFLRFPIYYLFIVFRMLCIKMEEFFGFYRNQGRFLISIYI